MLFFRLSSLDASDAHFSQAERRLALGGEARWRLIRGRETRSVDPVLSSRNVDRLGRIQTGRLEWSDDKKTWKALRPKTLFVPERENVRAILGEELTVSATWSPESLELPKFRAWAGPVNPGALLVALQIADTHRIQNFLDAELRDLPQGRIPFFAQDGSSDLATLSWLAELLTREADDIRVAPMPPSVVLTGGDGSGWHLAPLHGLKSRREVADVPLPRGLSGLSFHGWISPTLGPWAKRRSSLGCCGVIKGEGQWDPKTFADLKAAVLPLRLPDVDIANGPKSFHKPLWVVGVRDRIDAVKHEIELTVCNAPNELFAPRAAPDAAAPGGMFWVEINNCPDDLPDWNVPCKLLKLKSAKAVPVLATTIYSGADQVSGVHFVPEKRTCGLIHWSGRLSEPPVMIAQPRPMARKKSKNGTAAADIRNIGRAVVQLPKPRPLVVQAPALEAIADKDVRLKSREGIVHLHRENGRVLQVGQTHVEVDPLASR